jgi:hypothetical protein
MATARARSHKHFQMDAAELRRAQRVLRAHTETETIERALDMVITFGSPNFDILTGKSTPFVATSPPSSAAIHFLEYR